MEKRKVRRELYWVTANFEEGSFDVFRNSKDFLNYLENNDPQIAGQIPLKTAHVKAVKKIFKDKFITAACLPIQNYRDYFPGL